MGRDNDLHWTTFLFSTFRFCLAPVWFSWPILDGTMNSLPNYEMSLYFIWFTIFFVYLIFSFLFLPSLSVVPKIIIKFCRYKAKINAALHTTCPYFQSATTCLSILKHRTKFIITIFNTTCKINVNSLQKLTS